MTLHYTDDTVTLHHGDCLDILAELPDASIDAIVTDPPYGLEFMGREWDAPWQRGTDINADAGFTPDGMGKGFTALPSFTGSTNPKCFQCKGTRRGRRDGTALVPVCMCPGGGRFPNVRAVEMRAFQAWCQLWAAECLRVLKPGGHLLAFGGTRTYHRLTCAVEDAGFEIRDSISWLYGSGFPKSLDVSKAIDRASGAERETVGEHRRHGGGSANSGSMSGPLGTASVLPLTAPATDDAKRWQGWGTALKPAHEPVVCARKPFNPVPFDWRLVADVHHALAGLLWLSLSSAKRAALSSPSSPAEPGGPPLCVSALVSAALGTSPVASEGTATFSSPATESMCLSIASSWSAILGALSDLTKTSTIATRSSTTTALRILNSLLDPLTSQTTMPACESLLNGPSGPATAAADGSSGDCLHWRHRLETSAVVTVGERIAPAVESVLASIAGTHSSGQAAGSSAAWPVTTPTETSTGSGTSTHTAASSPAHEPIVVARKPLTGTVAANVLAYGTGALNIDATRVGSPAPSMTSGGTRRSGGIMGKSEPLGGWENAAAGRWPPNVLLDESQAAELDRQSGTLISGALDRSRITAQNSEGWRFNGERSGTYEPNSGGASRFFPTFRYEAKAPTSERVSYENPDAQALLFADDGSTIRHRCTKCGKHRMVGRCVCPEPDFQPDPSMFGKVAHPTVKPLDLMRWLVRLVTPPGGTVLDPFAGSGTTGEACVIEGFGCILIEREPAYLPLIVARLSKPIQPDMFGGTA